MSHSRKILAAEDRLHELRRARRAAEQRRLQRQAYEPIYRKYRTVVPSIFTRNGDAMVFESGSSEAAIIEALKDSAVFTLDTASELRWGVRLVRTPNVSAYLRDADRLEELAANGVLVRDKTDTFIYASPFPVGPRLFAAVNTELPPHEALPSGHRVVTTDRLVREFIGTLGLRLDLLTLLDTCIEQNLRFGSVS